jgi:hypothetical protein
MVRPVRRELIYCNPYIILDRLRLFASLVHRNNIPVDLKMFIVDKKQNQCAFRRCSERFLREK